jgi:hypothetical protein
MRLALYLGYWTSATVPAGELALVRAAEEPALPVGADRLEDVRGLAAALQLTTVGEGI